MRALNEEQAEILKQLYYFRFATSTLLTETIRPKHRESVNSRLNILYKHKLIGKHYDKSYKINRKPATYFLLPESFKYLREEGVVSELMLKRIYNDRKATDSFIAHCLTIFELSNKLNSVYGNKIEFFTESEFSEGYDFFPKPLPDGFIRYQKSPKSKPKSYFLHIVNSAKPFFTASRKLDSYIVYADSDKWDRKTEEIPKMLFVCEQASLESRLQKQANRIAEEQPSYLHFYTTTKERLLDLDDVSDNIWLKLSENDERRTSIIDM